MDLVEGAVQLCVSLVAAYGFARTQRLIGIRKVREQEALITSMKDQRSPTEHIYRAQLYEQMRRQTGDSAAFVPLAGVFALVTFAAVNLTASPNPWVRLAAFGSIPVSVVAAAWLVSRFIEGKRTAQSALFQSLNHAITEERKQFMQKVGFNPPEETPLRDLWESMTRSQARRVTTWAVLFVFACGIVAQLQGAEILRAMSLTWTEALGRVGFVCAFGVMALGLPALKTVRPIARLGPRAFAPVLGTLALTMWVLAAYHWVPGAVVEGVRWMIRHDMLRTPGDRHGLAGVLVGCSVVAVGIVSWPLAKRAGRWIGRARVRWLPGEHGQ